jgi:NitT/TauT family transport system permease protein
MSDTEAQSQRPELVYEIADKAYEVVPKPLSSWQRFWENGVARKVVLLMFLALLWETYARSLDNDLIFPTFSATVSALVSSIGSGELLEAARFTIVLLLKGYLAGIVLAAILTVLASTTRIGADFLETVASMFNPLPSIAMLPLALIWFGIGEGAIVFVLIHAVLWAVALNAHAGCRGVSLTLKMVGQNYGLSKLGYITRILLPGAFPSILTGLKVGWAFAWRTMIAAELVFGASGGSGGLGWFINNHKNQLNIPNVFAGLLTVIVFGLLVENLIFRTLEARTIQRWGMET